MRDTAIAAKDLVRTFRRGKGWRPGGPETKALDGLSLEIAQGEVHGLLGPNGAGKTTFCKILSTVLVPSAGSVRVLGYDVAREPEAVRPLIGIVFGGERGLYGRLSARQNLLFWAALYKMPTGPATDRADALLARFGLAEKADTAVETFSRGMKQRVHLARGLLNNPRLIVFDEPTTGMDPVAAHDFRSLVGELRSEGRTVLITTHDMAEAEEVCDRVSLIDAGRVAVTDSPRSLVALATRHRWVEAETTVDMAPALRALDGVVEVSRRPDLTRVKTEGEVAARRVVDAFLDAGVLGVRVVPPRLEDVYLEMVGARKMDV